MRMILEVEMSTRNKVELTEKVVTGFMKPPKSEKSNSYHYFCVLLRFLPWPPVPGWKLVISLWKER